jgi:branched-chain amino acid transport system permease protein
LRQSDEHCPRAKLCLAGIPPLTSFPLPFGGEAIFDAAHKVAYYLIVRVLWLLVIGSIQWILHSRFGFGLRAIRDSRDRGQSLGVNLSRSKTMVFAVSALLPGVLGAFYAH